MNEQIQVRQVSLLTSLEITVECHRAGVGAEFGSPDPGSRGLADLWSCSQAERNFFHDEGRKAEILVGFEGRISMCLYLSGQALG